MSGYTVNELLTYYALPHRNLTKLTKLRYSQEEIVEAKLLIAECRKYHKINISKFSKNCISSNVEQKHILSVPRYFRPKRESCSNITNKQMPYVIDFEQLTNDN